MQEKGFTLWFTGLSGSGKLTIANLLVERFESMNRYVELLDGDEVRLNLTKDLGFSKEDRDTNINRIAFVARLLSRNGVIAITAAISPYSEARERARTQIENFVEVYVSAPLEVCIERDVKGLYKKALAGEILNFTGVWDPYEVPDDAEIIVPSHQQTPEESLEYIIMRLSEMGLLREAVAA